MASKDIFERSKSMTGSSMSKIRLICTGQHLPATSSTIVKETEIFETSTTTSHVTLPVARGICGTTTARPVTLDATRVLEMMNSTDSHEITLVTIFMKEELRAQNNAEMDSYQVTMNVMTGTLSMMMADHLTESQKMDLPESTARPPLQLTDMKFEAMGVRLTTSEMTVISQMETDATPLDTQSTATLVQGVAGTTSTSAGKPVETALFLTALSSQNLTTMVETMEIMQMEMGEVLFAGQRQDGLVQVVMRTLLILVQRPVEMAYDFLLNEMTQIS